MRTSILAAGFVLFALTVTIPVHMAAQQAAKPAPRPKATTPQTSAQSRPAGPQVEFTAKSANVAQAGTPVKIQLWRWSSDEERMKIVGAFSAPPAASPQPPAATSEGGGRGRDAAAGRAGRGAAGARGRGGRGGRDDAAPATPEQRLEATLTDAPTLGYIWTNDVTGYAIKYAVRMPAAGGERIVLVTDRRLGIYTTSWNPVGAAPTDYDFTLLELRLDAKGGGEGKTSLAAKIAIDNDAHTLALDNFMAAPVQLQGVRRRAS
jgi:hypothetical protein